VCTGCANGCNVHVGVANNRVYRYVPRRNDAVNDTWICDPGRLSYKRIGSPDRLKVPMARGELGVPEPVPPQRAIEAAAARLRKLVETKGAGVIAGVASAHATNEDLFTLRRLLSALGSETSGVAIPLWQADELLRKPEAAANGEGARALGFGDAAAVVDRLRAGGVEGLILLGHDLLDARYLGAGAMEQLGRLDTLIALDSHASELQRVAHVLLPSRVAAEKWGTLTNHAGRVQRVQPVVEPMVEALAEGEWLSRLGAALGLPGFDGRFEPREVAKQLSASVPAFAGVDFDSVGDAGRPLAART
jgi:NADH-quinone oxidoreductase subunit G